MTTLPVVQLIGNEVGRMVFQLSEEHLRQIGAIHTTKEIYQQPEVWIKIMNEIEVKKEEWDNFFAQIYNKHEKDTLRVIFTGAGTSAFIGDVLVPALNEQRHKNIRFEAIATTDIVSNPMQFLNSEEPTILVSFARSGNSPESVATIELAEKIIRHLYHIVITCNKDGELAQKVKCDKNSLLVLLPDEVNDRSFAMTSSFTSMLLVAYQLFSKKCSIESTYFFADYASQLLSEIDEVTEDIIKHNFERIVFLGSGSLGKLTREAALKMLELTNGQVASVYESSLGFRHGPKTFLNETTLVVLFISQNPYTKQYDIDILKEIANGTFPVKIVALSDSEDNLRKWADWVIAFNHNDKKLNKEIYFALLNTLFAQTLALKKSIQLGITPDNPVTDGSVNRVVKGVTIYKWEDE